MTLLVVLIMRTWLARYTRFWFLLSLASMAYLHELSVFRYHIQATKHAPPTSDGPRQGACGQPNAPQDSQKWLN